jgi:hypothetical protein
MTLVDCVVVDAPANNTANACISDCYSNLYDEYMELANGRQLLETYNVNNYQENKFTILEHFEFLFLLPFDPK